jgi:flagellin-like protein
MFAFNEKSRRRGVSPIIATILLVAITVVLAAVLYVLVSGYLGSTGSKPTTVGMVGGISATKPCTAGTLYHESISITSTSGSVTTNTLGLKVVPTAGGLNVPNVAAGVSGATCPATATGGWYAALMSASGNAVACYTNGGGSGTPTWSQVPSALTVGGYPCVGTPITSAPSPAVVVGGGQTLIVYMFGGTSNYVPPMAGSFTMQSYGLGGTTVSGSVDL